MELTDFLERFPEFAPVPADFIENILADCSKRYGNPVSGSLNAIAAGLLAAHKITCRWAQLSQTSSMATGIAMGQSGGSPSSGSEAYLRSTTYGAELDSMIVMPVFQK